MAEEKVFTRKEIELAISNLDAVTMNAPLVRREHDELKANLILLQQVKEGYLKFVAKPPVDIPA